jgi:hypothetical protein
MEPDQVLGKSTTDVRAMAMQRGEDGIWRMGRIFPKRQAPQMTPEMAARLAARQKMLEQQRPVQEKAAEFQQRMVAVTAEVGAGKYATADEVIHALYPEGSPGEKMRKFEEERNAADEKQAAEQQKQLLAQKFDPSTAEGAMGCFLQARAKRDRAGLGRFFYADGDVGGRLAKANAQRILDEFALEDAVKKQFGIAGNHHIAGRLLLITDLPEWFGPPEVKGETAEARGEGGAPMTFRKVGGVWKEDITTPVTADKRAAAMEKGNEKAERLISELAAGKYKTVEEVESALKKAGLPDAYAPDDAGVDSKP